MYVRLKPDASGAWQLDPKFKIEKEKILTFTSTKGEGKYDYVFHPSATQGKVQAKLSEVIVADFAKRRNVTFIAYGTAGTGKTYTCEALIPEVISQMKPCFQHTEQIAAEQFADKRSLGRDQSEDDVTVKSTVKLDESRSESPAKSRSPNRSNSPILLRNRKHAPSPLAPRIIHARSRPNSPKPHSHNTSTTTKSVAFMSSSTRMAEEQKSTGNIQRSNKPGLVQIPNNGRRGQCEALYFGDTESFVTFPPIKKISSAMLKCSVELYVYTDFKHPATLFKVTDFKNHLATLSIEVNKNEHQEYEEGSTIFYVRDLNRKELVAKITKDIYDNKWHFIQFNIIDLTNNKIQVLIDGQLTQTTLGQTDSPGNFHDWEVNMWVGVGANFIRKEQGNDITEQHFKGAVADFRVWDCTGESIQLLCHYPMDERSGNEIKDRGPQHLNGTAFNVEWKPYEFPELGCYFNGRDTYINCGCLGEFGKFVGNASFEFWFRTSCTTDMMSLFHVTDSMKKQASVCIELNTNSDFQYAKGVMTLYVRDSKGSVLCCTTDTNVYDDRWYNLVWKISSNASSGQMSLSLNGMRMELNVIMNQNPSQFIPFSQWCGIGAANKKGRKLSTFYKGFIKDFKITHSGHSVVAHWPLNEGIGNRMAMDVSGSGNNGVCRIGNSIGMNWLAVELPFSADSKDDDSTAVESEKRWDNNEIKFAYVQMYSGPSPSGLYQELVWDLVANKPLAQLEELQWRSARGRKGDRQRFVTIPRSCWKDATAEGILSMYQTARSRRSARRGHDIMCIKLGDAHLCFFELVGCSYATRSTFDPVSFTWTTPVTNFGTEEKAKGCVNKSHNILEHCLMELGWSPQMVKRSLVNCDVGLPAYSSSVITQLLHYSLLHGDDQSRMYLCQHCTVEPVANEALSIVTLNQRMRERTSQFASMVIQKTIRAYLSRKKCNILKDIRDKERARSRRVMDLVRRFPKETAVKQTWIAILIGISHYTDPRISPLSHPVFDCWGLGEILAQLGYQVTLMLEECGEEYRPTRANIVRVIKEAAKEDAQFLVYISGYGQKGFLYSGPSAQDLKLEHDEHIKFEEKRKLEMEEEERIRKEEEEKKRKEDEEAEKKRQEEEDAKGKLKKGKVSPKASKKEEPKEKEDKKDDKKEEKKDKDKPKGKKAKKDKGKETEEEHRRQEEAVAEELRKKDELQTREEEDKRQAEQKKKDEDERKRHVTAEFTTPVSFVMCRDSPLEFLPSNVLTFESIKELLCAEQPTLGQHAWIVMDTVPCGDALWWYRTEEEQEIEEKSGVARRTFPELPIGEVTTGTYFTMEDSTNSRLVSGSEPSCRGWGTYYLKRALQGWAQVRQRKNASEVENNRVTFDSMRMYLRRKLTKADLCPVKAGVVTLTETNEYVGEFNPANKIVLTFLGRKERKRAMKKQKAMFTVQFAGDDTFDVGMKETLDGFVRSLESHITAIEGVEPIEVKKWEIHRYCRISCSGNLLEASLEQHKAKWSTDIHKLLGKDSSKCTFKLEVGQKGYFHLHIDVTIDESSFPENPNLSSAGQALECLANVLEHIRSRLSYTKTLAGFPTAGYTQFVSCRCTSPSIHAANIEKLFRSGGVLNEHLYLSAMERFTEQQMAQVEEEDKRAADEEKKRAEELSKKRLLEMEQRKKEEEKMKQEMKLKDEIMKKINDIRAQGTSAKITEDDVMYVFQVHHSDVLCSALSLFTELCEKVPDMLAKIVRMGIVEYVCKGLNSQVSDPAVVIAGSKLIAKLASTKRSKEEDVGEEVRKSTLKFGGISALMDALRIFLHKDELSQILSTISPLCETELKSSIALKGGCESLLGVAKAHAGNADVVANAFRGLAGLCPRFSEFEKSSAIELAVQYLRNLPQEPTLMQRCLALITALAVLDEGFRDGVLIKEHISAALQVMKTFPDHVGVQHASLNLLEEVFENEGAREEVASKGVVPLLLACGKAFTGNSSIVTGIVDVLSTIIETPQVKESRVDVIVIIKTIMQSHTEDEGLQETTQSILSALG